MVWLDVDRGAFCPPTSIRTPTIGGLHVRFVNRRGAHVPPVSAVLVIDWRPNLHDGSACEFFARPCRWIVS